MAAALPGAPPTAWSLRELGEGPPLLLIHGLMTTGYSWRRVLGPLGRRRRVLVPDLPGAGRSAAPPGPLSAARLADGLAALMAALEVPRADVVGNSMGGLVALELARRHPDRVHRLVLVHPPARVELRHRALGLALAVPGAEALLGALIARDPLRWAHRQVHYYDESLKSLEEAREYGDPLVTAEGLRGFVRHLRDVVAAPALGAQLRRLRADGPPPAPTTLIYARQDPMVDPASGPALHALLPGSRLVWEEEGGHFLHVDRPAAFLRRLTEALEEDLTGEDLAGDELTGEGLTGEDRTGRPLSG